MIYRLLFFLYLISLCFYDGKVNQICAMLTSLLLLLKIKNDYRKCTLSYFECKIRKIKKEQGFVHNSLAEIYDINKSKYKNLLYLFMIFIILLNLKKCIYN